MMQGLCRRTYPIDVFLAVFLGIVGGLLNFVSYGNAINGFFSGILVFLVARTSDFILKCIDSEKLKTGTSIPAFLLVNICREETPVAYIGGMLLIAGCLLVFKYLRSANTNIILHVVFWFSFIATSAFLLFPCFVTIFISALILFLLVIDVKIQGVIRMCGGVFSSLIVFYLVNVITKGAPLYMDIVKFQNFYGKTSPSLLSWVIVSLLLLSISLVIQLFYKRVLLRSFGLIVVYAGAILAVIGGFIRVLIPVSFPVNLESVSVLWGVVLYSLLIGYAGGILSTLLVDVVAVALIALYVYLGIFNYALSQ